MVDDFIFWEPLKDEGKFRDLCTVLFYKQKRYFFPAMMNPVSGIADSFDPADSLRIQRRKTTAMEGTKREIPFDELARQRIINWKKPHAITDYESCYYHEFPDMMEQEKRVVCLYPIRMDKITYPFTVVLSNQTGDNSNRRQPCVLGVYAGYNMYNEKKRGGGLRIWTFREHQECMKEELHRSFGLDFAIVIFLGGSYRSN